MGTSSHPVSHYIVATMVINFICLSDVGFMQVSERRVLRVRLKVLGPLHCSQYTNLALKNTYSNQKEESRQLSTDSFIGFLGLK